MSQEQKDLQERLRRIPAVDQLLLRPPVLSWVERTSRGFVVAEIQEILSRLRASLVAGAPDFESATDPEVLTQQLDERLRCRLKPGLRTVINATGVILHTNLGRAPLSLAAQTRISAVSGHYTNLEYDLTVGTRSQRDRLLCAAFREVTGCEAAAVVNNNAAAVFLILNTLASGREVLVSRGELIEIGGSFRIPDIMARSGARLREVGTTNKTRIRDYEEVIGPDTALILRVHPSNYRIRGFTDRPGLPEMVEMGRRHRIPLVEDLGSGCLVDLRPYGITGEPLAQESIGAGADLICFSADKLLGGPQAGIIAGAAHWVDLVRANPLSRTYRVDKLIYGALDATMTAYRTGRALEEIPVLHMIAMPRNEIRRRSTRFLRLLENRGPAGVHASVIAGESVVGGGSCPDSSLAGFLIALASDRRSPGQLEGHLRSYDPPIITRLEDDRMIIDLRTVFPSQEESLLDGLVSALA